jgi:hypothetical protein
VLYELTVGNKIPETKQEWSTFALGVPAIALGVGMKDSTLGLGKKSMVLVPAWGLWARVMCPAPGCAVSS